MHVTVIDIGQSGSRLRSDDGQIRHSHVTFGPSAPILDSLAALLQEMQPPASDVVGLSLTGLRGVVSDPEPFGRLCSEYMGARRVAVADDGLAGLYGALRGADGISLAVGTGVSVVAKSAGRTSHKDGAGPVLGDDGGGYGIGREGLRAALRAAEGRGPQTMILEVAEQLYGPLVDASRSHSDDQVMRWCVDMAASVLECAQAGDAVAMEIRSNAAGRLADSAAAAWRDIADTNATVLCSGTGGILRSSGMRVELERALRRRLPSSGWQDPAGTNLDGITAIASMAPQDSPPLLKWWFAS